MFAEFKTFLLKTNALALAIGVIIGAAIGKVVGSLVSDVLMPVISLGIPGGAWRDAKIVLATNPDGTVKSAIALGPFLGSIIDFLIVAAAVFLITKMILKPEPEKAPPPTKDCPECRQTVPKDARRCMYCTQPV